MICREHAATNKEAYDVSSNAYACAAVHAEMTNWRAHAQGRSMLQPVMVQLSADLCIACTKSKECNRQPS